MLDCQPRLPFAERYSKDISHYPSDPTLGGALETRCSTRRGLIPSSTTISCGERGLVVWGSGSPANSAVGTHPFSRGLRVVGTCSSSVGGRTVNEGPSPGLDEMGVTLNMAAFE